MPLLNTSHTLSLPTLEHTLVFGQVFAQAVQKINPGSLLLYGTLGAGKTTFTRSLVTALPGGNLAEPASPSFTICNIYCTAPKVHHYDLYRLEHGLQDEAFEESLDDATVLTIVEWPERLSSRTMPLDGISCHLMVNNQETSRTAILAALGPLGEACLSLFLSLWKNTTK